MFVPPIVTPPEPLRGLGRGQQPRRRRGHRAGAASKTLSSLVRRKGTGFAEGSPPFFGVWGAAVFEHVFVAGDAHPSFTPQPRADPAQRRFASFEDEGASGSPGAAGGTSVRPGADGTSVRPAERAGRVAAGSGPPDRPAARPFPAARGPEAPARDYLPTNEAAERLASVYRPPPHSSNAHPAAVEPRLRPLGVPSCGTSRCVKCITLEPGGVTIFNSIALIHPARTGLAMDRSRTHSGPASSHWVFLRGAPGAIGSRRRRCCTHSGSHGLCLSECRCNSSSSYCSSNDNWSKSSTGSSSASGPPNPTANSCGPHHTVRQMHHPRAGWSNDFQ